LQVGRENFHRKKVEEKNREIFWYIFKRCFCREWWIWWI